MFVFKAAVVGAGTMGGEIAQVIAAAGLPVALKDVKQEFVDQGLEKAREVSQGQLGGLVKKEKISQEQADQQLEEIVGRIHGTTEYDGFSDVDFVIEAVPERMEVKQSVFDELDVVSPGHAILASNTSSLSITEMGEATSRPDKVVGFHFFYPASVMRLIEVIEGDETSEDTMQTALNFAQQIRKPPIRCAEAPGFVVNRILNSAVSEIWKVRDEEDVPVEEVDKLVSESGAAPMGPFFLADLLGLDTVLHVAEHLRESLGDRFYVSPKMKELVEAGNLGQKTGQGFFPYPRPDDGSPYETIALETRGDVGILWLDRPPANPLSPQVIRELADAWHSKIDGRLRAVVIASSNPFTFSAGADIKEFTKMKPDEEGRELIESGHGFMTSMEKSRTVTIASVNSIAFGGGCELAMACDFRIAAESATFGQPEINLGIIPGLGGTQRLPRLVGEGKALEMNLTGDPISSYEALRYGLVNQVVPDHELFDTALSWARKLAEQAPIAIEQIKSVSAMGELGEGLGAEAQGFAKAFTSEDAKEGISAFLGKRKPRFKGK